MRHVMKARATRRDPRAQQHLGASSTSVASLDADQRDFLRCCSLVVE